MSTNWELSSSSATPDSFAPLNGPWNVSSRQPITFGGFFTGVRRRWRRERRRRKVGRAYDMALEIARIVSRGSQVLDVGCGNGFIAHHLSAMLGANVVGIDIAAATEAPIEYRRYDGTHFPISDQSLDAVLLCYVLHHAQNVKAVLAEIQRVLRPGGMAIVYEDIPAIWWDRIVCSIHNRHWLHRSGRCTFRSEEQWSRLFQSCGYEVLEERRLARARNFAHPVKRHFYCLRAGFN